MDTRTTSRPTLVIAGSSLFWAPIAFPATHVIHPDRTGDFPTIQKGPGD